MQDPALVLSERDKRRFAPIGRQPDQAPTDLLLARRIDAGAEHGGEELRAEADADDRLAAGERRLDHREVLFQERVAVDLVDADGRAEHHENIGVLGR